MKYSTSLDISDLVFGSVISTISTPILNLKEQLFDFEKKEIQYWHSIREEYFNGLECVDLIGKRIFLHKDTMNVASVISFNNQFITVARFKSTPPLSAWITKQEYKYYSRNSQKQPEQLF